MSHTTKFLQCVISTVENLIHKNDVEKLVNELAHLREKKGRLFIVGVGGSAANASHACNDFRKLAAIESYCLADNVSELTARANDDGWQHIFHLYLRMSNPTANDALLVFSVGGGSLSPPVSANIVNVVLYAKATRMKVFGIVGRDGGFTAAHGDCVIIVPTVDAEFVTPIAESFQAIIWHSIVSHPKLAVQKAKWEGMGL